MLLRWRFCEIAAVHCSRTTASLCIKRRKKQVVKNRHLYSPLFRRQNFLDTKKYSAVYNRFQSGSNVFIAKIDPCVLEEKGSIIGAWIPDIKNQTSVRYCPAVYVIQSARVIYDVWYAVLFSLKKAKELWHLYVAILWIEHIHSCAADKRVGHEMVLEAKPQSG